MLLPHISGTNWEQTAQELAGAFCLSLWDRFVLQSCRGELFARHAVVALGALNMSYKSQLYEGNSEWPAKSNNPDKHYSFALVHYDRAMKFMRLAISDLNRDLWKALLSCLFIYCFESFQGREHVAISHAQSGQKLLQDRIVYQTRLKNQGSKVACSSKTCVLDIDLIHAFARLDLLVLTAIDTRSAAEHSRFEYEGCTALSEMPSVFRTIADAKIHIELLMRKIGHFMASSLGSLDPTSLMTEPIDEPGEKNVKMRFGTSIYTYQGAGLLPAHRPRHAERTADLRRLFAAFEPLVQEVRKTGEDSDLWHATARLQIHARIMKVLLAGILSTSESCYDRFLPDFKAVVTYASRITQKQQPSFNFDLSLIPPIGVVALRCRDWRVWREVLAILKRPIFHREMFWDKDMLEAQARAVMDIEEEGLRFGELIPERRRVRILSVTMGKVGRSANTRILQNVGKGLVVKEKVTTW